MIQINGNSYAYQPGMTVYECLETHGFQMNAIAVERNQVILPKSNYQEHVEDGDHFEVVQFVGGG